MSNENVKDIIPAKFAIKAMVDGSYKNTAYALAELIDNSIEAGADYVELITKEVQRNIGGRRLKQLNEIILFDDGCGMDPSLLHAALQIGVGSRLEKEKQTGMGRFGMGLPLASISQAELVEVWSWQDGFDNAYFSYLNVVDIQNGIQTHLNQPQKKSIPGDIKNCIKNINNSGTIIRWTNLPNPTWKQGESTLINTEAIIGRMYRYFLNEDSVEIRLANYDQNNDCTIDRNALPNDPLYLMKNTSTPTPWDAEPMFNQHREEKFREFNFDGGKYTVRIKASVAKKDARVGDSAGNQEHGRHAKKNIGISVLRAGREIEMITAYNNIDVTERWWGLEIEFPPKLDDFFGISNDKQSAKAFKAILEQDINDLKRQEELYEKDDPHWQLIEFASELANWVSELRKEVQAARGQRKGGGAIRTPSPEGDATKGTKIQNIPGASDEDEKKPLDDRLQEIISNLIRKGYSEEEAKDIAEFISEENSKYYLAVKDMATVDFFNTEQVAGCLEVTLNLGHRAFMFLDLLNRSDEIESLSQEELKTKAHQTVYGLKLILYAWARMRDEATPDQKRKMDEIRTDWGKKANLFFSNE